MHLLSDVRSYTDEWGPKHWASSRFNHLMKLRQAALKTARERWADYILVRCCHSCYSWLIYVASVRPMLNKTTCINTPTIFIICHSCSINDTKKVHLSLSLSLSLLTVITSWPTHECWISWWQRISHWWRLCWIPDPSTQTSGVASHLRYSSVRKQTKGVVF